MEMLYSEMPNGQFLPSCIQASSELLYSGFCRLFTVADEWPFLLLTFFSHIFTLNPCLYSCPLSPSISFILALIPQPSLYWPCFFYPKPSNSSVPTLSFSLVCGKFGHLVHVAVWICSCPQASMK